MGSQEGVEESDVGAGRGEEGACAVVDLVEGGDGRCDGVMESSV
jgi:hypothetical protein